MKKQKLEFYEIKARRSDFHHVDISTGEDMMLEITRNPNYGTLHYHINSSSTGRQSITRQKAAAYLQNYNDYIVK
jgi:hypothetical protein